MRSSPTLQWFSGEKTFLYIDGHVIHPRQVRLLQAKLFFYEEDTWHKFSAWRFFNMLFCFGSVRWTMFGKIPELNYVLVEYKPWTYKMKYPLHFIHCNVLHTTLNQHQSSCKSNWNKKKKKKGLWNSEERKVEWWGQKKVLITRVRKGLTKDLQNGFADFMGN